MERHTTTTLLAALAFGLVMAAASGASQARQNQGQLSPDDIRRCEQEYADCLARVGCTGNETPQERALCEQRCEFYGPLWCQPSARQGPAISVSPNGTLQRRR